VNPHKIETKQDADNFKTQHGGCRPATAAEKKQHPVFDPSMLKHDRVRGTTDWLAAFVAVYRRPFQGPSGICTACAASAAVMGCALNVQGLRKPQTSDPFGYLINTTDTTFSLGSGISSAVSSRMAGCCTDAQYSEAAWLANWQNKAPYPPALLPQPPAYADAPSHKVTQYASVIDLNHVDLLLDSGHPVSFGLGNHAMCLFQRSADGYWYYGLDSEMGDQDFGNGPGIRAFTRTALASAYDMTTVLAVSDTGIIIIPPPPPPPPGGTLSTPAQVIAAIPAVGPWSPTDYASLQAAVAAAAPAVQPPPPPSGTVPMPQLGGTVTDSAGRVWTWGAFVSTRYGYTLLCNNRAIATALAAELRGGTLWYNDAGAGGWQAAAP
jgi:hypothetical protein